MSASGRPKPPAGYDENPELTSAQIAALRAVTPWTWALLEGEEYDALRGAIARIVNTPAAELGGVEAIQRDLRERFPDLVES